MVPTLQKYDKLIVDKLSYHFTTHKGDIVVSYTTSRRKILLKDAFIKRVGFRKGGSQRGRVYINDQLWENYIEAVPQYKYGPVTVPPVPMLVITATIATTATFGLCPT